VFPTPGLPINRFIGPQYWADEQPRNRGFISLFSPFFWMTLQASPPRLNTFLIAGGLGKAVFNHYRLLPLNLLKLYFPYNKYPCSTKKHPTRPLPFSYWRPSSMIPPHANWPFAPINRPLQFSLFNYYSPQLTTLRQCGASLKLSLSTFSHYPPPLPVLTRSFN